MGRVEGKVARVTGAGSWGRDRDPSGAGLPTDLRDEEGGVQTCLTMRPIALTSRRAAVSAVMPSISADV